MFFFKTEIAVKLSPYYCWCLQLSNIQPMCILFYVYSIKAYFLAASGPLHWCGFHARTAEWQW